jgi:hypothetical protein
MFLTAEPGTGRKSPRAGFASGILSTCLPMLLTRAFISARAALSCSSVSPE